MLDYSERMTDYFQGVDLVFTERGVTQHKSFVFFHLEEKGTIECSHNLMQPGKHVCKQRHS